MKAMNFYTANGWVGSNYDSKLSTKEISARVRIFAKKNFPDFKFSVRTERSMCTDSMYIELKAGTCIPFVEGSRSAERGYMSTMSTVKGWEDELTPEMFKVLDAVTTYASSFRYDDSDGMQDYFDTNFYIHIKVGDEYQVVEPKEKKNTLKKGKEDAAGVVEYVKAECLEIVDYSEKAIAVFGDTKAIKEQLKELGGRFNPSLNYNGEKRAGWIFSKKQADKVKELIKPTKIPGIVEVGQKEFAIKEGDLIAFKTNSFQDSEVYRGSVEYKEQLGFVVFVDGVQYELRKAIDIRRLQDKTEHQENETYPLENISFTETDNLNGVCYYDIEGAGVITSAKVRADIQPGDIFNVYTNKEWKFGVTYDGVSLNRSLYNALPGIIEFDDKIESGTLSTSSYYSPMAEGVEFYEKKVNGKRYTVKDKPLTLGHYGILDNLDNCIIDCYPTKGEAEREAEILNGFTDGNGRLKSAI